MCLRAFAPLVISTAVLCLTMCLYVESVFVFLCKTDEMKTIYRKYKLFRRSSFCHLIYTAKKILIQRLHVRW